MTSIEIVRMLQAERLREAELERLANRAREHSGHVREPWEWAARVRAADRPGQLRRDHGAAAS